MTCLRMSDLRVQPPEEVCCYLNHPSRCEDSDDMLIDVANQLDFTRKDLHRWVKSKRSHLFMEKIDAEGGEIDITDFHAEFDF